MDKNTIKVLQVVPSLESGGVERGALEIAKSLVKAGYVSFIATSFGKMIDCFKQSGTKVIKLPLHSKNPLLIILNSFLLAYYIWKYKIDIVHARSRAPAWSCYLACLITRCNYITTFHGTYSISGRFKLFYNSVMLKSDLTIAVSNFIAEHIKKNYNNKDNSNKVIVVNRGVDTNYFHVNSVTEVRVKEMLARLNFHSTRKLKKLVLPGRFVRWKGHVYLLECLNLIKDLDFICYFIGHCSKQHQGYLLEIKDKISRYGLEKKVKIMDAIDDMPAMYSVFDIVLVPSVRPEAFGRVVVEAQAMKKLVIATKHGGAIDTIDNKKTGVFIPVNNVRNASEVIKSSIMMNDFDYNEITKQAFQNVIENYSTEMMCKNTLNIYKNLLL